MSDFVAAETAADAADDHAYFAFGVKSNHILVQATYYNMDSNSGAIFTATIIQYPINIIFYCLTVFVFECLPIHKNMMNCATVWQLNFAEFPTMNIHGKSM